jgi:hypothetical protein
MEQKINVKVFLGDNCNKFKQTSSLKNKLNELRKFWNLEEAKFLHLKTTMQSSFLLTHKTRFTSRSRIFALSRAKARPWTKCFHKKNSEMRLDSQVKWLKTNY